MQSWIPKALKLKYDDGLSWIEVAKELKSYFPKDLNTEQIKEKIRSGIRNTEYYKQLHEVKNDEQNFNSSIEYKSDGTQIRDRLIEIAENEEITPTKMLEYHGLDPFKWEVISYKNNYWHNQIKGGKRLLMYQSKITVKPTNKLLDLSHIDEHFNKLKNKLSFEKINYKNQDSKLLAELNISDLHLGRIVYNNQENKILNSEDTKNSFRKIIQNSIQELKSKNLDYILFIWSNDFFNSDTKNKTTTNGTPQDTELPWQQLFDLGVELLVEAIMKLEQIAPVKTIYIPANHDEVFSYHAIKYLEAWFREDPNVEVITDTYVRKYIQYGNTLIGFTHGDKLNPQKLSTLMPVEVPDLWSNTKYREFHIAHLHSEHMTQELNGVIVRRISASTFNDEWTIEKGFVSAIKKSQIFIYDREKGLTHIINIPI